MKRFLTPAIGIALVFLFLILFVPGGAGPAAAGAPRGAEALDTVIVPPGDPVEIAVANSLIIPEAGDMPLAVQMAAADYGPIQGFSVQLNDFDTGCDAGTAAGVAATIVANAQHVGVVGPLCSSSSSGALPVFESALLVMVTGSSTSVGLHSFGPNVFNRTVVDDPTFEAWNLQVGGLASAAAWEADFETLHGYAPWELARYAYDAATLLLTRIDEVASVDGGGNLVIDRAALAAAVRTTTGFAGVTGSVGLNPDGDRVNQYQTAYRVDNYDGPPLNPQWSWIDEDPTHWSLAANPGFLRIVTQTPGMNRLVMPAPAGDFEFRARVLFEPTENFQFAGISLYTDNDNTMNFGRAFCSFCSDNAIYFDFTESGVPDPDNYPHPTAVLDEAYVRIIKSGNDYTGFVSTNATFWEEVGTHTATTFEPLYIGLYAAGQSAATEIPADYDFFVVEYDAFHLYLPLVIR